MLKTELFDKLASARLNVTYHKAVQNKLWYQSSDSSEIEVLDMAGGFGATILGHNHPRIKRAISTFLRSDYPIHVQGSAKPYSTQLAQRLSDAAKGTESYRCILTNSGAEAVEAAIKHAEIYYQAKRNRLMAQVHENLAEIFWRQKPLHMSHGALSLLQKLNLPVPANYIELKSLVQRFNEPAAHHSGVMLSLQRAFHGQTLGALQLTYNKDFRKNLDGAGPKVIFLDPRECKSLDLAIAEQQCSYLEACLDESGHIELVEKKLLLISALFVEPIQGEAGVWPIEQEAMAYFRAQCTAHDVPFIIDEIQCGMGRTGSFLASTAMGISGDYILLSKGLGGGVVKIGALLVVESKYVPAFSLMHGSTFGEDELSSQVSLATLDLLFSNDSELIKRAAEYGNKLKSQLLLLQSEYPDVIKDIRGRGLMLGVELRGSNPAHSRGMRVLDESGGFMPLICGFLLHETRVRIMPTLSGRNTLRLEPSVFLTEDEICWCIHALQSLCKALREENVEQLTRFIATTPSNNSSLKQKHIAASLTPPASARMDLSRNHGNRVAFLAHINDETMLDNFDVGFSRFSQIEKRRLIDSLENAAQPWLVGSSEMRSPTGKTVNFSLIAIPFSSQQIVASLSNDDEAWLMDLVNQSIDMAVSLDCGLVGLGQFTSIIAKNGTAIKRDDIAVTTGNSLTVSLGCETILKEALGKRTLAVIGAAGNIGDGYTRATSDSFEEVILIGSGSSRGNKRLETLAGALNCKKVRVSNNIADIKQADVIIAATSSPVPFLTCELLKSNALVCDISVPRNVHPEVLINRPDVQIIHGGLALLPYREEAFTIGHAFKERGTIFACMAETILLGMYGRFENFSYGDISIEKANWILEKFHHERFELCTNAK